MPVLYADESIIVVDKPHFLATTPRGMWYRQSALIRLRERFGDERIVPAHRLDRMTAGVVLFVRDPALRGAYQMLFQSHRTVKVYECLAPSKPIGVPATGTIRSLERPKIFPLVRSSHIVKTRGRLQAYEVRDAPNAETRIELGNMPQVGPMRHYVLHPRTGKTHQLRVHMNSLGLPIQGDDLYPRVVQRAYDDFSQPLQLVARSLAFIDPVDGSERRFVSQVPLEPSLG